MGKSCLIGLFAAVVLNVALLNGQDKQEKPEQENLMSFTSRIDILYRVVIDEQVMKDLEIVGSQKTAIQEICKKYTNDVKLSNMEIQEKFREIDRDQSMLQEAREIAVKRIQEERERRWIPIAKQAISDIEGKLLPHQFKRLDQLASQRYQLMHYGTHIASVAELLDELDVPKDKLDRVKREIKEVEEQYRKQLAKLQEKYRNELVRRLPQQTQEKVKQLVGEFKQNKGD